MRVFVYVPDIVVGQKILLLKQAKFLDVVHNMRQDLFT